MRVLGNRVEGRHTKTGGGELGGGGGSVQESQSGREEGSWAVGEERSA